MAQVGVRELDGARRLAGTVALAACLTIWTGAGAGDDAPPGSRPPEKSTAGGLDDPTVRRALERFRAAERAYSAQQFEQARRLYAESYRQRRSPELLFNIAQCWRNLGRCGRATFFFHRYLAARPDSSHARQVEAYVASCPDTEDISEAWLADASAEPPGAARPAATTGERGHEEGAAPVEPHKARASARTIALWTGVAVTSALVAAGSVTGGLALSQHDRFEAAALGSAARRLARERGKRLSLASTVTFGAAGAAALTTTILYLVLAPRARERQVQPSMAIGPTGARAGVSVRF